MKRIIFYVIFGSFLAVSGFAQVNLQPAAIVNLIRSEPITVGQLRTEVEQMERSAGRALTQAERLQVLDTMINERLAIQAAERDRVTITENEVNQQIQQLRSQMAEQIGRQPTDAEFNQAIRTQTGLDINAFREQLRRQMIVQKYLLFRKEDSMRASIRAPTEQEIVNEYNFSRSEFIQPETVRFSMILVPYGADAAARTRARELANRLFQEIGMDPSKFDEVALRSRAPNSGYQAGDFGYLPMNQDARSTVGDALMNASFSLRQGEVSSLIEGIQGYQIIKITEKYAFRNLGLDDIILGYGITVREYIRQLMLNQREEAVVVQASQELIAELRAGRTFQVFENNLNW
jgi:parvulin-like peptidyl-prolyl isomerase